MHDAAPRFNGFDPLTYFTQKRICVPLLGEIMWGSGVYLRANGKLMQALVETLRGLSRGLLAAERAKTKLPWAVFTPVIIQLLHRFNYTEIEPQLQFEVKMFQ